MVFLGLPRDCGISAPQGILACQSLSEPAGARKSSKIGSKIVSFTTRYSLFAEEGLRVTIPIYHTEAHKSTEKNTLLEA